MIALTLASREAVPSYARLGALAGIATSEAHAGVQRLLKAGLVDRRRRVKRAALLDFLSHGAKHSFPVQVGGPALGFPTGAAAPSVRGAPEPEFGNWVWPSPDGTERGLAVAPLYPTVPAAANTDAALYELLALVDLLRVGSAREASHARKALSRALTPGELPGAMPPIDVSSVDALKAIFTKQRVAASIAKAAKERDDRTLVRVPAVSAALMAYGEELAEDLAARVAAGAWSPSPAYHVVVDKGAGATRDLSFPTVVDAIVARRIVDELEVTVRAGDGERVFMGRRHASSRAHAGDYSRWGAEWARFVTSAAEAARSKYLVVVLETDIEEFYPSVDHADAHQALARRTGSHAQVTHLLFACLEAWLPRTNYRRGGGLPLDPHDVSGLVAHALLKSVDDAFPDSFALRYRRFVDDTVFFVDGQEHAAEVQHAHRAALAAVGLRPNLRKTRQWSTDAYLAARCEDEFRRLDAAATIEDVAAVQAVFDFVRNSLSSEQPALAAVSLARRCYSVAARLETTAFGEAALEDVASPALGEYALRYLARQTLGAAAVEALCSTYGAEDCARLRIGIARVLMEAELTQGARELFGTWAERMALEPGRRPGEGHARGLLLLGLFRHGHGAALGQVAEGMTPALLVDPHFRLIATYALRASGSDAPWVAAARYRADADLGLLLRLLDDAESGTLPAFERVLGSACRRWRRGRYVVPTEMLPFLVVAARGAGPQAVVMQKWLRQTVDPERAPADVTVVALLKTLLTVGE